MGFLADLLGINKPKAPDMSQPQVPYNKDPSQKAGVAGINPEDLMMVQDKAAMVPNAPTIPQFSPAMGPAEPPRREGMFGISGVGRDILGLIGDAVLMRGGQAPLYTQKRIGEQEADRYSQVAAGFTEDPLGTIRKMAQAGYGKEAQALYQEYQKNEIASRKADAEIGANASLTRKRDNETNMTAEGRIGNVLSYANAENYPQYKQLAEAMAERAGITLDLPDQYDEDQLRPWREGSMTLKDAEAQDLRRDIAKSNMFLAAGRLKVDALDKGQRARQASSNEGGRNQRAADAETGKNRRAADAEAGRNRRAADANRPVYNAQNKPWKKGDGQKYQKGYNSNGQYGLLPVN